MLRLAPVGPGGEAYYYDTVLGVSDQPDGLIEADPVWMGSLAAERWPGAGSPTLSDAKAILGGVDPVTGEVLANRSAHPVRNVAHDLMLSVPKGVSLAYVLGGPEVEAAIGEVLDNAVRATLRFLEDEVVINRRGERSPGVVALSFLHRTSRLNDPHLHDHVVIVNLVGRADGTFGTIASRPLYRAQTTGRLVFEAEIRRGLTALGIPLGAMRHGFADIAGLEEVTVRFSRRSTAIAELADAGANRYEIHRLRPEKDRSTNYETLQAAWREMADRAGLSEAMMQRALGGMAGPSGLGSAALEFLAPRAGTVTDGWVAAAADPVDGTITRASLIQARCRAAPAGASVPEVLADVDRALNGEGLVRLGVQYGAERFRTAERQAELSATAAELAARGRAVGTTVIAHAVDGRLEAFTRLGELAGAYGAADSAVGSRRVSEPVLAVAPGERAASCFEASTGIPTIPIDLLEAAEGGERLLVVADGAGFTEDEHRRVLDRCEQGGADLVLIGAEVSFGQAELLQPLLVAARRPELQRPTPEPPLPTHVPPEELVTLAMGPRTTAILVQDQAAAVEAVQAVAARHTGCVVAAPDRALVEALGPGAVDPKTARARLTARAAAPEEAIETGIDRKVIVAIGGAPPLEMRAPDLARHERVHVLIGPSYRRADGSPDLGRVGEAVRAPHLTKALGTVLELPAAKAEWRAGADIVERHRLAHGLERETSAYGRQAGRTPTRDADELAAKTAVDQAMPLRLARAKARDPGRSLGR